MSSKRLRAWLIWLVCALFMFYKYALEVSPSIMTQTLMKDFAIDGAQLGNLAASYFYAYLLLQIPAGVLLDKWGPKVVMSFFILLSGLGSLVFAYAPTFTLALIGRFLTGMGTAFAVTGGMKLIGNWFPQKEFAFMTGLFLTIAMMGAVCGQAPLAAFIALSSWRHAIFYIALFGIALSILFFCIVQNSPLSQNKIERHPYPLLSSLKKVVQNKQSWWLSIYSGLAFSPVMVFGGLWGVSFVSEAFGS